MGTVGGWASQYFFRNSTKDGTCNGTIFGGLPAPLEPWGEAKRSNIITKSNSKIFKPNFVCLLTNVVVGFVALRPKSTATVIAGRSVHLTTLFPGQA